MSAILGMGEKIKYGAVWADYQAPVSLQVLGLQSDETLASVTCALILDGENVESVEAIVVENNGMYDIVRAIPGPFVLAGTYYLCFTIMTSLGYTLPAVVQLDVSLSPAG